MKCNVSKNQMMILNEKEDNKKIKSESGSSIKVRPIIYLRTYHRHFPALHILGHFH